MVFLRFLLFFCFLVPPLSAMRSAASNNRRRFRSRVVCALLILLPTSVLLTFFLFNLQGEPSPSSETTAPTVGSLVKKNDKTRIGDEIKRDGKRTGASFDLNLIRDPVNELRADDSLKQLHHGVYRVTSSLQSLRGKNGEEEEEKEVRFAFKTECRPAAKWHGQQGWTEIAAHNFAQLFYDGSEDGASAEVGVGHSLATVPLARGVVVRVSTEQLERVVHRDRCGLMTAAEVEVLERATGVSIANRDTLFIPKALNDAIPNGTPQPREVLLMGVAITWQDSHDDNAIREVKKLSPYFSSLSTQLPSLGGNGGTTSAQQRERVLQVSDVLLMDYLLLNEDREDKNWFFNSAQRIIMMDNGWAFAGRNYVGSACDDGVASGMLRCPPLFRFWWSSKSPRRPLSLCGTDKELEWCRFRHTSVEALRNTLAGWGTPSASYSEYGPIAQHWLSTLQKDTLVGFLITAFGNEMVPAKQAPPPPPHSAAGRVYSVALARYVHGCAGGSGGGGGEENPRNGPYPAPDETLEDRQRRVLGFLYKGIATRLQHLTKHVDDCVSRYGEGVVFMNEMPPHAL